MEGGPRVLHSEERVPPRVPGAGLQDVGTGSHGSRCRRDWTHRLDRHPWGADSPLEHRSAEAGSGWGDGWQAPSSSWGGLECESVSPSRAPDLEGFVAGQHDKTGQ